MQHIDDVLLNPGPLYHNAPFGAMHTGLFTGAHVVEMGRFACSLSSSDLLAHMEERLVRYKIPRSIEFSATPLRDDAGKVRRSALREARMSKL
jgi:acyl-CoA synthetase (AMP-forming)/AMP-acid ligase II